MTVSVSTMTRQLLPAGGPLEPSGVLFSGKRWATWSFHDTRKQAVTRGNQVQADSRSLRVRVTRIAPKVRGRSWAVVIKRK